MNTYKPDCLYFQFCNSACNYIADANNQMVDASLNENKIYKYIEIRAVVLFD